jgi:hypothetical protein
MKKKITKLFAVMAIAATPAAANPVAQPDPWAVSAAVSPFTPDETLRAIEIVISRGFAALARSREQPAAVVARPRTMPSGAPACGNVGSRAARPVECSPRAAAPILADTPAPVPHIATGGAK